MDGEECAELMDAAPDIDETGTSHVICARISGSLRRSYAFEGDGPDGQAFLDRVLRRDCGSNARGEACRSVTRLGSS